MGYPGHNFTTAVGLYSKAIELNPRDATVWCNRAAARTKLEEYGFALDDACEYMLRFRPVTRDSW